MKLYCKLFLYTALPFGFCMGVYEGMRSGVYSAVLWGIGSGMIFGVLMSSLLVMLQKLSVREGGQSIAPSPVQVLVIEVAEAYDEVFGRVLCALDCVNARLRVKNRQKGYVEAAIGVSLKSFGEIISITIYEELSGQTRVEIKSVPKLKMTIIDYGKGRDNVSAIARLIRNS